ncbi:type II toxin-antitoxin system RelE/ParE family toxin [Candidatus Woesearchaeota archaeon]|nr:type II toxin-antitoxin system RelE/ParE family toxin [Candidatus Woesearchaeota archaeon]
MSYEVRWTGEAKKNLKNLERELIIRLIKKVEEAKENPFHYFAKLVGKKEWKLRIGDYRAIVDLDSTNEIIYVLRIGHRKNIYDKD